MTEKERRYRRFSEEFKKEKVRLIESGQKSIRQVCEDYEVSRSGVNKWLTKYSKKSKPEWLIYEKASETSKISGLNTKITELEQAVGKQQMEIFYLRKIIELSSKELGEDLEKKTKDGPLWK
jgi:transposase-like protein